MPDTRSFLRLIQSEAAAGDPRVQQTVLVFCDWLEEVHGDVRADWLRGLAVCQEQNERAGWYVSPIDNDAWQQLWKGGADVYRELARRVREAMTRPCDKCVLFTGSGERYEWGRPAITPGCRHCHGDGWLLTEAERCECWRCKSQDIRTDPSELIEYSCPDCNGRGWRIKEN